MAPTTESTQVEPAGGLGTLVKAALPSIPGVNALPGVKKSPVEGFGGLALHRPPVRVEREHVAAYAAVCGFPSKDTVPFTYPHMLAFGLHMGIMTDTTFPAPAIGTVHVANSITGHRPIGVGETLSVSASVAPPSGHPKGLVYDFATQVHDADDTLVWESTSTYLRFGKGDKSASSGPDLPTADPTGQLWSLPGDLGRRYAAVSGDHNPIHLYPLTAKALGFPRQIAHGMWSLARCVAALESWLPDAARVDVAFKKPILLPGRVAFGSRPLDDAAGSYAFSLTRPKDGAPHLVGRTTAV
ncbi:MaoC family dehydratase [Nocardioides acrostichi]|uniref:MaoC family dehydratase n=1 Tax=Nocardioides acrostichi TaxID=2784339 RepID=UPI002E2CE9CF|nr:MaoC/PaaZ C-terminal domain-containing protein [Nocardioides acrostichi]